MVSGEFQFIKMGKPEGERSWLGWDCEVDAGHVMAGRRQAYKSPSDSSVPTSLGLGWQIHAIASALFYRGSWTRTQVLRLTKKTLLCFFPSFMDINLIG